MNFKNLVKLPWFFVFWVHCSMMFFRDFFSFQGKIKGFLIFVLISSTFVLASSWQQGLSPSSFSLRWSRHDLLYLSKSQIIVPAPLSQGLIMIVRDFYHINVPKRDQNLGPSRPLYLELSEATLKTTRPPRPVKDKVCHYHNFQSYSQDNVCFCHKFRHIYKILVVFIGS